MLLDCNFLSYIVAALACSMKTPLEKNAARLAVLSVGIGILYIASFASPTLLDLANAQENKTLIQSSAIEEKNKALVLKAFDTLFNRRDYVAAERYWSPNYIQHSAHIEPGREGLFDLVKSSPPTLKYEPGTIVADGDFVIVHGKFSGRGQPVNWIAADILYIKDGVMVEHWDVIQDEASQEQSKSGLPMFGDKFPNILETTK
jgi:predicted SnoaL-like aldol condensation-catalyzing enzyme